MVVLAETGELQACVGTKAQHCIGRWWRNGEARVAGNLPELAGFGGWWLVEDGEADPAAS